MGVSRDQFVDSLSRMTTDIIPDNFEEYTKDQLTTHIFNKIFDSLDKAGLVPNDVP